MDDPNAFERPPEGKVSDPDLRRLFRSVTADAAADDATEVAWRNPGLGGGGRLGVEATGRGCLCTCSANESVELLKVFEAAAKRCAASCTFGGKVPALALRKPEGKFVGGKVEVSTGDGMEGLTSLGGEPPEEAKARSAGGLYRPAIRSSA